MDVEEDKFFGLCKCCLQDGCFRSLWVEYDENGEKHNYGEMLNECFSLQWSRPDNLHLEQICDGCSKRTADAYSFRKQVLASHKQLVSCAEPAEWVVDLDAKSDEVTVIIKQEMEEDYEEVEYLEEDEKPGEPGELKVLEIEGPKEQLVDDPDYSPEVHVATESKWRPKKRGRQRTYKNYTSEDLMQSVEAAKSGRMTVAEAAAAYNVPRKTVAARLLSDWRGLPTSTRVERDDGLIKEVQTLLTYTNMIPYSKTRTPHYHCAYCNTDGPRFIDPDELRTHTRTKHADERIEAVENFLRPQWLNEILKVDIENLHCTVCCTILATWNDMFQHLTEQHQLVFNEAYTRVIPYILKLELSCALCKQSFSNYHHLDSHMNTHYNNYMCSECGDTFLSSSRLKKHVKVHETGQFICDECGKVFTLEKYRKKHIEVVHKQEQEFQCLYCPEKFDGEYSRHLHVLEKHKEKVVAITCEFCRKTFDWRPYFLAHIRKFHKNEKNWKCTCCGSRFFSKSKLERHEASHVNKKKKCQIVSLPNPKPGKYACKLCGKQYSSKNCLITHYSVHGALDGDSLKTIAESSRLNTTIDS